MNDRGGGGKAGAVQPDPSSRHDESSALAPGRPGRSSSAFAETGELTRTLYAYAPRRSVLALLLLLTAGVTEEFGLLVIVPLLYLAGFATPPGEGSPTGREVLRWGAPEDRPGAGAGEETGAARHRRSDGSTRCGERTADPRGAAIATGMHDRRGHRARPGTAASGGRDLAAGIRPGRRHRNLARACRRDRVADGG